MKSNTNRCLLVGKITVAVAAMAGAVHSAQAIDIDAGDYTAAPAGTDLGLLYLQHAERDKLYSKNDRLPGNNKLDSDIGILRLVHFMDIGGYIVDPQVLLPFGRLKAGGDVASLGKASGVGDVILAATVWLKNDPATKTYFGVTPFLTLPTGKYDRSAGLNLGENRWKLTMQAAYITPLTDSLTLDVAGDATVYGKNDDAGSAAVRQTLKQDPSFQAQGWLRYHLSQTSDLRLGLSQTWSGKTKLEGVSNDDRGSTSKVSVGGSVFLTPSFQLLGYWGRDLSVREGFKESNRVNLRLLQIF